MTEDDAQQVDGVLPLRPGPRIGWLVAAGVAGAVLLTLSHLPGESMPLLGGLFDKLVHALAYGSLALFLLKGASPDGRVWPTLMVFVGLAAVGAIDEVTQPLAGRTCALADWMADIAGVSTMVGLWWVRRRLGGSQAAG